MKSFAYVVLPVLLAVGFCKGDNEQSYSIGIIGKSPAAEQALREAGYPLTALTWDDFLEGKVTAERFSCLLFAQPRRFPCQARQALQRYMKDGGDLILLNGPAFEVPVFLHRGRWYSPEELLPRLAADAADRNLSIDFAKEDPARWIRDCDNPGSPSTLQKKEDGGLTCFEANIRQFSRWDTFRGPFQSKAGHNALWLKVRGSDNLRQLVVEIREQDGSRWVAVADCPHQWQEIVLLPSGFQFLPDGSPSGRGGSGDGLCLEKAAWLQFGMSYDYSPHPPADYQICLAQAGTAKIDLPDGFGKPLFEKILPIFSAQPFHQYNDAVSVRPAPNQSFFEGPAQTKLALKGTSAIGFPYINESKYTGILQVFDSWDRFRGFAAGVLEHYEGPYKGGQWLLFGVQAEHFYQSDLFKNCLLQTLQNIRKPNRLRQLAEAEKQAKEKRMPRPKSRLKPIRLSSDGKHFIDADGKPFFMLGVNYIGSFDCKTSHASDNFFYDKWEADFRKARNAGINCLRLWIEGLNADKNKMDSILHLADQYGLYLLLHPTAHPKEKGEDLTQLFTDLARLVSDEPAVIGYDLQNEPYITTVGAVRIAGRPSAVIQHDPYNRYAGKNLYEKEWVDVRALHGSDWPPVSEWASREERKALLAAYNILARWSTRYIHPLDYSSLYGWNTTLPLTGDLGPFFEAVNQTFADWLNLHIPALRSIHPSAFITVGYNSLLTALPANSRLDFVNHHLYQPPTSFENLRKAVTTFDRLREIWPDKPITLGEFGYSCGTRLPDGSTLDIYNAAVGELMIYLYAWTNGFDGAMSWMVSDWPIALIDYSAPWVSKTKQAYEAGFGMYYYDGTETGYPKPIVGALRTFRDYLDLYPSEKGKLELRPDSALQTGCGWLYQAPHALFAGAKTFQNEQILFRASQAANLMLYWTDKELYILSTADAQLTLKKSFLQSIFGTDNCSLEGRLKTSSKAEEIWTLELLESQPCRLRSL
ncbi:MAG: hypothetical protein WHS88_05465 [Anaerohalosphaeraceae bacterium]